MVYAFDYWGSLPVIVSSISFFYMTRFLFERINAENKLAKFIESVSATTFGIYLIHIIALIALYKIPVIQTLLKAVPYLGILLYQIITFSACSLVIFPLRKVPFIKWFL